ncbi:MAG: helix-turn-helix transcriptional regulator [Myxococcales bacterium]|nr:helix-turn-helix transcriptional regulator [Myxococcales bacterium]
MLKKVAEGKTYREVSQVLYLSPETLKQHMKNIFQKLHVSNRTQATVKAQVLRLLPSIPHAGERS